MNVFFKKSKQQLKSFLAQSQLLVDSAWHSRVKKSLKINAALCEAFKK